jgi:hypothetical protein
MDVLTLCAGNGRVHQQVGAMGEIDCFGAGVDIQLPEDIGNVGAGGFAANEKGGSGLRIGAALCNEPKDIHLPPREAEPAGPGRRLASEPPEQGIDMRVSTLLPLLSDGPRGDPNVLDG